MKPRGERFWAKVVKGEPDECWDWRGTTNATGYGRMRSGTRASSIMEAAHRVSLELKLGRPLVGSALHTCDRPICVNPAHLYEGVAIDNARDRDVRGRTGGVKLTPEDVRLMRSLRERGWTFRRIASSFRVSEGTAWNAITSASWKHVK